MSNIYKKWYNIIKVDAPLKIEVTFYGFFGTSDDSCPTCGNQPPSILGCTDCMVELNKTLEQDETDQLRQEYLDFEDRLVLRTWRIH